MIILGLDIATKTGWAFLKDMQIIESGVQDFAVKRGESAGMKFFRFRVWIENLLSLCQPDVIYYEQAHYRGGAATECCVGLITRVHEVASVKGINYTPVHSSTLKKFVTGGGKADKSLIISVIEKKFNIKAIDDNHADAIGLAWYGIDEINNGNGG